MSAFKGYVFYGWPITYRIELLEKMSFFAILVAWETTDLTKRIIKKLSTTLSNAMRKWIYESFFNYVDQILPIIDPQFIDIGQIISLLI